MAKPREWGRRDAKLALYRVETLRAEGFTEGEVNVFSDRRFSSLGMRKIRRARARELKGLSELERREWAAQRAEAFNEQTAADWLRKVSPDLW